MWLNELWQRWMGQMGRTRGQRRRQRLQTRKRTRLSLETLEDRTLLTAWTALGPAPIVNGQTSGSNPVSGRITGVAADPTDANTVYVATAGGGIWKTTDATNASPTWTPLTDNLTDGSGNPIPEFMGAVAETDATSGTYSGHQIVYAGAGEANNGGDCYYGEGILVSTDGGSTWTLTTAGGAFSRNTVAKIVIDPSDTTGATAYAAVGTDGNNNGMNGVNGNMGIWKTTNFGATWTNMTGNAGLATANTQWSDVVIDPHTPSTVYAAEGEIFGSSGNGIYKSTDGGSHWSLLTAAPHGTTDGRIALAIYDNGTTKELLAAIAKPLSTDSELLELIKSTNGGSSFSVLSSTPNYMGANGYGQGWYDTTLAIDPANPNYIYAGGSDNGGSNGNIESFNGGSTWQSIVSDSLGNGPHSDDHGVAFDANGNLLDGNDGGIFRLNNPTNPSTQTWSDLNTNLQITQFYGIAVAPTNPPTIYGGAQDNGTSDSNGSLGWNLIAGGDGGITRVDPTNSSTVYQEYTGESLYVSTNGGLTFTPITSGVAANTVDFIAPYQLDSSGNIYYGTDYLNYSSNHGSSWTQIGTPGLNGFNPSDAPIDAVAVNPVANSNVVYVSAGGHLFVTKNAQSGASATWTELTSFPITLPNGFYAGADRNNIAVDPSDTTGGTAYVVVNEFTTGGVDHVLKTTNFGATWTDISGNLPNTPCDSVAVSPDGKTVYLGTDVGVYSTSDGGSTWAPLGTGFPNAMVTDLENMPSLGYLYAGTHGRGAWEISLATGTAPVVTTNPISQTVYAGQNVTFTAAASGNPTPTVQWEVSTDGGTTWSNINGATSTTLTLSSVTGSMNGYEYEAVFTNIAGSATTSAATLTVQTTLTWTGGGSTSNWSDPNNWGGATPVAGDSLIFGPGASSFTSTNDLASGTSFKSITFTGTGYTVGGNSVVLTGGVDGSQATGNNSLTLGISLASNESFQGGGSGTTLTLGGAISNQGNTLTVGGGSGAVVIDSTISGSGKLIENNTGSLTLSGTTANTFTGLTTVESGTLELDKTGALALAGPLTVGTGAGTAVAQWLASNQLASAVAVTVGSLGTLDLNGNTNTVASLTLSGGTVQTEAGSLTLSGNVSASGASTLSGNLALTSGSHSFTVSSASTLTASALISGSGSLSAGGSGTLVLSGANTYSGGTSLSNGTLEVGNSSALGSGVLTLKGGTLSSTGGAQTLANSITLGGTANIGNSSNLTFTGAVTLTGNRTVNVGTSAVATFTGSIGQSGTTPYSLTKSNSGTLILSAANTYTGGTILSSGILEVGNSSALGSGVLTVSGGTLSSSGGAQSLANAVTLSNTLTIGNSSTLTFTGAVTLTNNRTVNVGTGAVATLAGVIGQSGTTAYSLTQSGSGTLILSAANTYSGGTILSSGTLEVGNTLALGSGVLTLKGGTLSSTGGAQTLANSISFASNASIGASSTLTFTGAVTLTGNRMLTVGAGGTATFAGAIGQSGTTAYSFTKAGAGTVVLSGSNTYTGSTNVNAGTLLVNGSLGSGKVSVANGAILGGSGTMGPISVSSGGTLQPSAGGSPAILSTSSVTLTSGSTFSVALNGATPGAGGYDQLNVSGPVNLGNSTLNLSLGFTPTIGETFTIIQNNGTSAVVGTFKGLPEAATFVSGGMTFQISYKGGNGKSVVLTRIA